MKGIAVDAAHSMKNRKTEYQGIDLETGKYLFYCDMGNQTINIGVQGKTHGFRQTKQASDESRGLPESL